MKVYLRDISQSDIPTHQLPSIEWAKLRLTQLLINSKKISEAKRTFLSIEVEDDKRFENIYKKLKKAMKKT